MSFPVALSYPTIAASAFAFATGFPVSNPNGIAMIESTPAKMWSRQRVSFVRSHSVIQLPAMANQSGSTRIRTFGSPVVAGAASLIGSKLPIETPAHSAASRIKSPVRSSVVR